jgi:hypothetical protein
MTSRGETGGGRGEDPVQGLYALPLDRFIAARTALARELKQAGEKERAEEVAALRKPSLVAWTVNQLAHTRRRDVDLLLDAGKRLVDAQQASISTGGRGDLDAAQSSLRSAVSTLTSAAGAILGSRASPSTLARVAETLRSAATAAAGRELLARGMLEEALSDTGWDIVAGLTPAPRGTAPRDPAPPKTPARRATQDRPAPATAELDRAAKAVAALERAVSAAERRLREATRKEQSAAERLEAARAARTAEEKGLEAAGKDLAAAERELERLRRGPKRP